MGRLASTTTRVPGTSKQKEILYLYFANEQENTSRFPHPSLHLPVSPVWLVLSFPPPASLGLEGDQPCNGFPLPASSGAQKTVCPTRVSHVPVATTHGSAATTCFVSTSHRGHSVCLMLWPLLLPPHPPLSCPKPSHQQIPLTSICLLCMFPSLSVLTDTCVSPENPTSLEIFSRSLLVLDWEVRRFFPVPHWLS